MPDGVSVAVGQRYPAGDPVRAVLADLDRWLAAVFPVDRGSSLGSVDRVAERSGRTVADGADDLVHPAPAWRHERAVGVKHGPQPIGAEPRVLADPAVVEYGQLHPVVAVALVGHPLAVLLVG